MNNRSANILAQGSIRSFRLSGRAGFLVIPAFHPFRLSIRSSCPVYNLQFSGHFSQTKLNNQRRRSGQNKSPKLVKKSPVNFVGLSGNGNSIFSGKKHVQIENNPRNSRNFGKDRV
jgi:hypothetical protein